MMDSGSCHSETLPMPTDRPKLSHAQAVSTDASSAQSDATALRLTEARRLACEVEALLVEAAKDPRTDAYALRIAQGLARSLIDQLVERPTSLSPVAASSPFGISGRGRGGSARVA
jgi:hypothetical protein